MKLIKLDSDRIALNPDHIVSVKPANYLNSLGKDSVIRLVTGEEYTVKGEFNEIVKQINSWKFFSDD